MRHSLYRGHAEDPCAEAGPSLCGGGFGTPICIQVFSAGGSSGRRGDAANVANVASIVHVASVASFANIAQGRWIQWGNDPPSVSTAQRARHGPHASGGGGGCSLTETVAEIQFGTAAVIENDQGSLHKSALGRRQPGHERNVKCDR